MTGSPAPAAPPTRGRRSLVPRWRRPGPNLLLGGALFILALALRVWGVTWSLPYVGHVDEPKIVNSAVHIVKTGDFNPHLFIWPSLVIYAQALIYKTQPALGHVARLLRRARVAARQQPHLRPRAPTVPVGPHFSALVGAAAVAGAYGLGRAMFGRAAGLAGAAAAADLAAARGVLPLPRDRRDHGRLRAAGADRGLAADGAAGRARRAAGGRGRGPAAAAKYNGLYMALPVAVAWLLAGRRARAPESRPASSWPRWLALAARHGAGRRGRLPLRQPLCAARLARLVARLRLPGQRLPARDHAATGGRRLHQATGPTLAHRRRAAGRGRRGRALAAGRRRARPPPRPGARARGLAAAALPARLRRPHGPLHRGLRAQPDRHLALPLPRGGLRRATPRRAGVRAAAGAPDRPAARATRAERGARAGPGRRARAPHGELRQLHGPDREP